jgi:hypothetical protein
MPSLEAMVVQLVELAARRDVASAALSARTGVAAPPFALGAEKPVTPAVVAQAQINTFLVQVIQALAAEVDALKGTKKGGK